MEWRAARGSSRVARPRSDRRRRRRLLARRRRTGAHRRAAPAARDLARGDRGGGASGKSIEELSEWSGEPPEALREWHALGLIGGGGDDFSPDDVERARIVGLLRRRGSSLAAMARTEREQNILASYLHANLSPRSARAYSQEEAAAGIGLDVATVRRVWSGGRGFTPPGGAAEGGA